MLRIKALGSLTVVGPDGPIVNAAAQPKRLALLALLTRAGERGITRDKALGYFWPDTDEDRARRSLANALWAMRRDLGSDEVFLPGNDLRLNPDLVSSDVVEFERAVATGDLARAASLYEGPFLDGFRLAAAPEFERWVEAERATLAHQFLGVAEKLARGDEAKGDAEAAVGWWRRVVANDPLNARFALGLMRALVASGDRVGAVRHARIYEALIDQELDLPPDRAVVAFANELRDALASSPPDPENGDARAASNGVPTHLPTPIESAAPESRADPPGASPAELGRATEPVVERLQISPTPATPPSIAAPPRRLTRLAWAAAAGGILAVGALAAIRGYLPFGRKTEVPVLALGQIADYREDRSTELVKPLTDMLATALARCNSVRVVSTARMYELTSRITPSDGSPSPQAYVGAARAAGATELLEGALYQVDDTTLRLDVRRMDVRTGNVQASHSIVAHGPFVLADSATARLLADFDAPAPTGSIADVTTRSLAAYRFYEEGLRAFYQDDLASAERLFKAALGEDSTFASAAFYLALSFSQDEVTNTYPTLERAMRLAEHASDRERLNVRAHWEERTSSLALRTTAESLLVRYPQEVEGYLFTGIVRVADADYQGAVPYLERAIAMDSLGLHGARAQCTACEAFLWLFVTYELADSLQLAENAVRRWLNLQPRSGRAYAALVDVLMRQSRIDEGIAAWRERSRLAPGYEAGEDVNARFSIHGGDFHKADELMRGVVATGSPARQVEGYWFLALSARYQGRMRDALGYAKEEYRASREARPTGTPPKGGVSEGQVLQDLGRGREAAAIFESIARWNPGTIPEPDMVPGMIGRHRSWNLTHAASALASIGDTATLAARADTIQLYGARSLYRLHRELHHHVRGLLMAARRRDDEAIAEFRQALWSPSSGYTRTNFELGRVLLRRGRPAEAIAVVAPALRSGVEATNYYITRIELRELLAQAWDSLGSSPSAALPPGVTRAAAVDSAAAHYTAVAQAWKNGDPPFRERAQRARVRAAAIAH